MLPQSKRFRITALGASQGKQYIRSAALNGKPLERPWITHQEIVSGRDLVFEMSSDPALTGTPTQNDSAKLPFLGPALSRMSGVRVLITHQVSRKISCTAV
jgi:putative alpha-1,2-mannosidase